MANNAKKEIEVLKFMNERPKNGPKNFRDQMRIEEDKSKNHGGNRDIIQGQPDKKRQIKNSTNKKKIALTGIIAAIGLGLSVGAYQKEEAKKDNIAQQVVLDLEDNRVENILEKYIKGKELTNEDKKYLYDNFPSACDNVIDDIKGEMFEAVVEDNGKKTYSEVKLYKEEVEGEIIPRMELESSTRINGEQSETESIPIKGKQSRKVANSICGVISLKEEFLTGASYKSQEEFVNYLCKAVEEVYLSTEGKEFILEDGELVLQEKEIEKQDQEKDDEER